MYASQWFLTLFTAKFPLYMVFHIIDLLLCEVGGEPSQTKGPCLKKYWREALLEINQKDNLMSKILVCQQFGHIL